MREKLLFLFLVSLTGSVQSEDDGALVVYAHRLLRPGIPYELTAKSFHTTDSARVTTSIIGADGTHSEQEFVLEPGKEAKVLLQVDNIRMPPNGACKLMVTAVYPGDSSNKKIRAHDLECVPHDNIVLIQLSKPLYKADEVVDYRIIILTEELRLSRDIKTVDIYLKDPEQEVIEERLSEVWSYPTHPGFIEGRFNPFQIHPTYGDWTVEVVTGKKNVTKTFKLADYHLPRFAVYIEGPPHILRGESNIKFKVAIRDQTGNPVSGSVNVTMNDPGSGKNTTKSLPALGGTVDIDDYQIDSSALEKTVYEKWTNVRNRKTIKTHILQFCRHPHGRQGYITIHVDAEESVTRKHERAEMKIPYHCGPFSIKTEMPFGAFIPGQTGLVTVKLLNHDGRLITSVERLDNIKISLEQYVDGQGDRADVLDITRTTPSYNQGIVTVECRPNLRARKIRVTAQLQSVQETANFTLRYGAHIVIRLLDSKTWTIGDLMKFNLHCNHKCIEMVYSVVSRQGVLFTKSVPCIDESRPELLSFPVTADMAPAARIVAYYAQDHEIGSASVEFLVDQASMIQNVRLTVTPEDPSFAYVLPGRNKEAKVQLTAAEGSIVGLLAVDKNLLQLGTGHDITPSEVSAKFLRLIDQYQSKRRQAVCSKSGKGEPDCESQSTAPFTDANLLVSIFHNQHLRKSEDRNDHMENQITDKTLLRSDFRDSFMWITKIVNESGQVTFTYPVPDSITTWAITAFSANVHTPLGLTKSPSELMVYQDFYIHMDLPNTIIEGENVTVNISVYNFRSVQFAALLKVTVRLLGKKPTEFLRHLMPARPEECQTFEFHIGPFATTGSLIANASLSHSGELIDRVVKSISVIKAGVIRTEASDRILISGTLGEGTRNSTDIPITTSTVITGSRVVKGSIRVKLSVSGDKWAPVMHQLTIPQMSREFDGLIRLPCGCGEQNMAALMPNVFLAMYLKRSGWNPPEGDDRMQRLIFNIEAGFRGQAQYRRSDGSYSAFGEQQTNGSTWLTAYVVYGMQLSRVVLAKVDHSQIDKSYDFLQSKMNRDGSFREDGQIFHREYLGASANADGLTAFVLLAFLEGGHTACDLSKPKLYLQRAFERNHEPYAVGLICYALSRIGSQKTNQCIQKLMGLSVEPAAGQLCWLDSSSARGVGFTAMDIEATAYALLALNNASYSGDLSPAVKWLLLRRNGQGGFQSTQDTSVALNALSEISEKQISSREPLHIEVHSRGKRIGRSTLSPSGLIVETFSIPVTTDKVTVTASGKGSAFCHLEYKWNERPHTQRSSRQGVIPPENNAAQLQPHSALNLTVDLETDDAFRTLKMEICPTYNGNVASGMVLLQAEALTGYRFHEPGLIQTKEQIHLQNLISRVECLKGCEVAEFYFTKLLPFTDACMSIELYKVSNVVKPTQPRPVVIRRYYEPKVHKSVEYTLEDVINVD